MSISVSIMLPFLKELNGEASELLQVCCNCHRRAAADNNNLSGAVAQEAMLGSGSFAQAACAAILSTGNRHAPIRAARHVLREGTPGAIREGVRNGLLIAGFGNSFFKDSIDPAFQPLADQLAADFPDIWDTILSVQEAIRDSGKDLHPNAAILTAAVCEIIDMPDGIEEALFILPRLPVWADKISRQQRGELWA